MKTGDLWLYIAHWQILVIILNIFVLRVIEQEQIPKGQNVVTFGEYGTKFYIILQGSVAVRVPMLIKREFTLRGLLEFFVEHQEWLIKDEKYQHVLNIIQDFLPEIIKYTGKGYLYLNFEL